MAIISATTPWLSSSTSFDNIEWEEDGWMANGKCISEDPDIFFPDPRNLIDNKKAKAVCSSCPVRPQCFSYAITNDLRYGVWGGFGEIEREKLTGLRRKA